MRIRERKSDIESQGLVQSWFESRGVKLLDKISGNEFIDENWLKKLGIIGSRDHLLSTDVVTAQFLSNNKDFSDGWFRGGAESFYKVVRIEYQNKAGVLHKFIAFKAIHTLGNIQEKTLGEAAWMSELSRYQRAGRVYAAGNGTIIKDFFLSDSYSLPEAVLAEEKLKIVKLLNHLGLTPVTPQLDFVQHSNRLILVDLGSGDINGPDLLTFISDNI